MEERHELDRLDLEEQVPAPGDVRRQRGGEVDRADRERHGRCEGREALEPPAFPKRRGHAVDPEPPGRSVAQAREEIAPVLGDEPEGEGGKGQGDPAMLEGRQRCGRDPEGEPEVAFVNPAAENVNARPARVALETDHPG